MKHVGVGRFQVAGVGGGVVQGAVRALRLQALAQGGQLGRVGGQAQGARFVVGQIGGYQLGQAGGLHDAGRAPAGVGVAGAGEHGQAGPEGVAGGGQGVVGQGVEKEVGQGVARQVVVKARALGKHQPLGGDAGLLGAAAQVGAGVFAALDQPQHAVRHGAQQAQPDGEDVGRDFLVAAEGAKDECAFGQRLGAARRGQGDGALAVGGQIAVGQAHDAFAVVRLAAGGHERGVAHDVVHKGQAQRAGVADVVHGHGGGAVGQDAFALALGVAHEVNGDGYALRAHVAGHLLVAHGAGVHIVLEGVAQAFVHAAVLPGAVGVGVNLEALAVVQLEHFGQRAHDGVLNKVGREVGDAQARAGGPVGRLERGQAGQAGGPVVARHEGRALAMAGGVVRLKLPAQGGNDVFALLQGRFDAGLPLRQIAPVGRLAQGVQHHAGQHGGVWRQRQGLRQLGSGLAEALHVLQGLGALQVGVGPGERRGGGCGRGRLQLLRGVQQKGGGLAVVLLAGAYVFAGEAGRRGGRICLQDGPGRLAQQIAQLGLGLGGGLQRGQQGQGAGLVGQGFGQLPQALPGHAPAVKGGGVVGLERHGPAEGGHGGFITPQRQLQVAQVVLQKGVVAAHGGGALQPVQGLLQPALLGAGGAQQIEGVEMAGVGLQHLLVAAAGLGQLPQVLMGQALFEKKKDVGRGGGHER